MKHCEPLVIAPSARAYRFTLGRHGLELPRQEIMNEVDLIVDKALFQQEFEQSHMHITQFLREMEWASTSVPNMDSQARLAYLLPSEQRAGHLRSSLFRTWVKSWASTACPLASNVTT